LGSVVGIPEGHEACGKDEVFWSRIQERENPEKGVLLSQLVGVCLGQELPICSLFPLF
jgi:hypothetical protein